MLGMRKSSAGYLFIAMASVYLGLTCVTFHANMLLFYCVCQYNTNMEQATIRSIRYSQMRRFQMSLAERFCKQIRITKEERKGEWTYFPLILTCWLIFGGQRNA